MHSRTYTLGCLLLVAAVSQTCSYFEKPRFEQLSARHTGISFSNTIAESDTFNALTFEYIYNGGGVGVGDVNNDGLTDIFFSGNQVSSRLYLNKGDFKFEDVTAAAGVATKAWCTGVALADVNQDGRLDIYVSTAHPEKDRMSANLFFLNRGNNAQGVPVFEEASARTGLADSSYATQAAFFDYDRDGDLDAYILNNALESYNRNQPTGQRTDGGGRSVDRLYRNEGNGPGGLPRFVNVSKQAGIQTEGWGLGIVVNDLNQDGLPDVYVANDFLSNDHIWMNNGDGTFTNRLKQMLKHSEHNGMGVDIADINNDGLNEIVVMDMMPDDNLRQKTMFPSMGYDRFFTNLQQKYQTQYVRNALQLNNGNGTFSDIGYMAGVYATDWSWSSLFADFDNDGHRDLLITNGYRKDVTDLDFATYSRESSMFGTDSTRLQTSIKAINALQGVKKPNFMYRNKGDFTFENKAAEWGLAVPSYSNGAAYADFDNDGDLDLVMNNINDEALVYRNRLVEEKAGGHYLRLKMAGEPGNAAGIGAKVWVYAGGRLHFAEHQLQRGYKSTVEETEHMGLGQLPRPAADSVRVVWPRGKTQLLRNVAVDRVLVLAEKDAAPAAGQSPAVPAHAAAPQETPYFREVAAQHGLLFKHQEDDMPDFKEAQALLPRKHSQQGPGLAIGDLDGDGLDDVVIGGSSRQSAVVFRQQPDGTFRKGFLEDSLHRKVSEDAGLLLFDADNDGDNDLYCVSGSSEFNKNVRHYQNRLYRNLGKGAFRLDTAALPHIESSGSSVVAADYDHDNDLDLFVAGRISPLNYPHAPRSYLLQNDGQGRFRDVTAGAAPALATPGMVSAALWTDFDNDTWPDLLLAGEFMPLTFFRNEGGKGFKPHGTDLGKAVGWWNSLAAGDFDNDGDMDYIAGNLGCNSLYKASEKEPVCVYAKDYDQNGTMDPVLCRYINGTEYVTHPRETLTDQLVGFRRTLTSYATYGKATFADLFSKDLLKDALVLKATYFSSAYVENQGGGRFALHALPMQAQVSPVNGICVTDVNLDGQLDVVAVQNDYSTETLAGWYDAGIGVCLLGNGKGGFASVPARRSGFVADGDAKALGAVRLGNGRTLLVATQNQDSLRVFAGGPSQPVRALALQPADVAAEVRLPGGRTRRHECYYGGSYLSQSSRTLLVPQNATVTIINATGRRRPATPHMAAR